MNVRRFAIAALLLLAVGAAALGVAQFVVRDEPFDPSAPATTATARPSDRAVGHEVASYRGQTVLIEYAEGAFAEAHQHKVWYARDAWHAAMPTGPLGEIQLSMLDWTTQRWHETPTAIDQRPEARVDVLVEGDLLYVAAAGALDTDPLSLMFGVWELNEAGDTYVMHPDMPVLVADVDAEAASIIRAGDGAIWLLALVDGRMGLWREAGGPHAWDRITPPSGRTSIDTAMLLPADDGVAVAYIEAGRDRVTYAVRSDGGWEAEHVEVPGLAPGLDQLDGIEHDGRVYLVTRSSTREAGAVRALDPEIQLLRRTEGGDWSSHLVTRITDRRVSPVLAIDPEKGTIHVITSSGRAPALLTYKEALLETLQFTTGVGEPIVVGDDSIELGAISASRRVELSGGGLVMLVVDEASGQLMHAVMSRAGAALADHDRDPTDEVTERAIGGLSLLDTFEAGAAPQPMPAAWDLRLEQATASAEVVDATPDGQVARLVSGVEDTRTRACREWAPTTQRVSVSADIRIPRPGPRPATFAVGGPEGDVATALFEDDGELRVFDGTTEVRTAAFYRAGVWYRSSFDVDPEARTFAWRVEDRETGAGLLELNNLRWADQLEVAIDNACLRAPAAAVGASLEFDNVKVVIGEP